MSIVQHLALIPRDGFFCKDGRGWHTSSARRGHAVEWPWPSTVLGALRTAWGRQNEGNVPLDAAGWCKRAGEVKISHLLALRRPLGGHWKQEYRVWPVPMDALWLEDKDTAEPKLVRLQPLPRKDSDPRTLGRHVDGNDGARESLWYPGLEHNAKPLSRPHWWSEQAFVAWLAGQDKGAAAKTPNWGGKLIRRRQTRVGIDPESLASEDGALFSHDVIETLDRSDAEPTTHEWVIGASVSLPEKLTQPALRLGAGGRLAWIEDIETPGLFEPPEALLKAFDKGSPGLRLVAVTPARFQHRDRTNPRRRDSEGNDRTGGWLPNGFATKDGLLQGQLRGITQADVILRAAFVPRPMHISGWNITGGEAGTGTPKDTQRLVAPGAVYFFERANGEPFTGADAEKLWLSSWGAGTDEGFGRVVPGVWDPKDTKTGENS